MTKFRRFARRIGIELLPLEVKCGSFEESGAVHVSFLSHTLSRMSLRFYVEKPKPDWPGPDRQEGSYVPHESFSTLTTFPSDIAPLRLDQNAETDGYLLFRYPIRRDSQLEILEERTRVRKLVKVDKHFDDALQLIEESESKEF